MFGTVALGFNSESYEDSSDDEYVEDNRLSRRNLRDSTNLLEVPDDRFIANFRVSKEVFLMLLGEISPKMKTCYRSTHIPVQIKLATLLSFLATGAYQASIGNQYLTAMSKSQVSKVLKECLDIVEQHLCPKWITLDKTREEENKSKQAFYNYAGIPGVVGCVDGTHVRIKYPGAALEHLYRNRKVYYSLNVMAICDHNMVITYVDARNPGSNHDAFVWDQSAAHDYFKSNYIRGKRNTVLLGDSGYKLQPYMMTPYRNPSNAQQRKFNEKHIRLRNIIERCFGVLKNRFRCIIGSRGLHYSFTKAIQIVNVCCALHNICIHYKNNWVPSDPVNDVDGHIEDVYEETPEDDYNEAREANSTRDALSRNIS